MTDLLEASSCEGVAVVQLRAGFQVDPDGVKVIAADMADFAAAVKEAFSYAQADPATAASFGGNGASGVASAYIGLRNALQASLQQAGTLSQGMTDALNGAADWYATNDAEHGNRLHQIPGGR